MPSKEEGEGWQPPIQEVPPLPPCLFFPGTVRRSGLWGKRARRKRRRCEQRAGATSAAPTRATCILPAGTAACLCHGKGKGEAERARCRSAPPPAAGELPGAGAGGGRLVRCWGVAACSLNPPQL